MSQISRIFELVDRAQADVYEKFLEMDEIGDEFVSSELNSDEQRALLVKQADTLISKIPDLLRVIESQLKQLPIEESQKFNYPEKLVLYKEKPLFLRSQLKDIQLLSLTAEAEYFHKKRIERYVKPYEESLPQDMKSELFAGRSESKESSEQTIEDQILSHNKNITNSLKLTKRLMTMSVMQTELNIDNLDQQSKDLSQLNDKLVDLESVLQRSRRIVKFIEKQDKKDRRRIYISFGFLLLCCLWVLWRRVLKVPVKILMWTLFRVFGVIGWVNLLIVKIAGPSAVSDLAQNVQATHSISTTQTVHTLTQSLSHDQNDFIVDDDENRFEENTKLSELEPETVITSTQADIDDGESNQLEVHDIVDESTTAEVILHSEENEETGIDDEDEEVSIRSTEPENSIVLEESSESRTQLEPNGHDLDGSELYATDATVKDFVKAESKEPVEDEVEGNVLESYPNLNGEINSERPEDLLTENLHPTDLDEQPAQPHHETLPVDELSEVPAVEISIDVAEDKKQFESDSRAGADNIEVEDVEAYGFVEAEETLIEAPKIVIEDSIVEPPTAGRPTSHLSLGHHDEL